MAPFGAEPPPGTKVAGFTVERLLGRGGLGCVVLARDAGGNAMAIKLIDLSGPDSANLANAFEREVAICRKLSHPGIVGVQDTGRIANLAYIAMEYVAGGDLAHLSRVGQQWPPRRAAEIAGRIAQALAYAHAMGVVHHDIKPANILIDDAVGAVKLADFGLARLADLQRSRTGILAGTPAYMAPEQLVDGPQDVRSDLYSLGVLLFELVAGRLPYEAASLGELLRQVSQRRAPPLLNLQPQVPRRLSDLVAGLLEKEPGRRPASAKQVEDELQAIFAA